MTFFKNDKTRLNTHPSSPILLNNIEIPSDTRDDLMSEVSSETIKSLVDDLYKTYSPEQERAADKIQNLSNIVQNKVMLLKHEVIKGLLYCLDTSPTGTRARQYAMAALKQMIGLANRAIEEASGIYSIIPLLNDLNSATQQDAISSLWVLLKDNPENQAVMEAGGILELLPKLVKSINTPIVRDQAKAILGFLAPSEMKSKNLDLSDTSLGHDSTLSNINSLKRTVYEHLKSSKYDEALKVVRIAISSIGRFDESTNELTDLFILLSEFCDNIQNYNASLMLGTDLFNKKEYENATKTYQQALEHYLKNIRNSQIADLLIKSDQRETYERRGESTIQDFISKIQRTVESAFTEYDKGKRLIANSHLLTIDEFQHALMCFNNATNLDPKYTPHQKFIESSINVLNTTNDLIAQGQQLAKNGFENEAREKYHEASRQYLSIQDDSLFPQFHSDSSRYEALDPGQRALNSLLSSSVTESKPWVAPSSPIQQTNKTVIMKLFDQQSKPDDIIIPERPDWGI